jgi:FKBP-type peptidyl-prolyl cis-trans isomerase 2
MKFNQKEIKIMFQVFVCLLTIAGCATPGTHQTSQPEPATDRTQAKVVKPGDTASVHYLCRLRSGEVVAATDIVAEIQRKSNIYLLKDKIGPLSIEAVGTADTAQEQATTPYVQRSMEEEISRQLALAIVGMKEGDTRTAEIKAEDVPEQEAPKYIAHLTRVRTRPKEMKMPKGDYEYRTGQSPEVGQAYSYDPDFPGKVVSISDQEVTIRFSATPGAVIKTPFGPGLIRDDGEDYKVDIEARKGALVRTGEMAGHITDVDDKGITVDFGNPFGGETLVCDVTVGKIIDAKPVQEGRVESGKKYQP